MSNFYIADLHLGHENAMRRFDHRPFESLEEQDRAIIANINNRVSPQDNLYLLGDVSWYKPDKTAELIKEIKCKNRYLIVGNHDSWIKDGKCKKLFQGIYDLKRINDEGRIVEFEEKPEHPKSNLASMGIYIFNWKQLRKALILDMTAEGSHHDFGKDIIPNFLNADKRLYAYKFEGYWKDVGTIDSLWEANMDLLNKNNELNLDDPNWKIYTEDIPTLPHYVGPTGKVEHCYINQGAVISGHAVDSVLFNNVDIDEDAFVSQAVLMPNVKVGKGAKIYRAIVADGVKIDDGAVVGSPDSEEIVLISKRVKKGE